MKETQIIILAAGHGKRMGGSIPKALVTLEGTPMMQFVVNSAQAAIARKPIAVVGYAADMVKDVFKDSCRYALQEEQKGTGHAVMSAEGLIDDDVDTVVILYADQPFISTATIEKIVQCRKNRNVPLAIATAVIEDQNLFENQFYNFGRIIRDSENSISAIVEMKDADDEQKKVREVNPAYFCCEKKWLFDQLRTLKNDNAQGEYYLTDLVKIAFDKNLDICSVQIGEKEALGANTPEQLKVLESFLVK